MNAPVKIAGKVTMTSRDFNQHTGRAKAAADHGPLIVTDRGKPVYALLNYAEFERLSGTKPMSAAEAFADPNAKPDDLDLMDFIPERKIEPAHFAFDEDE